jgi:phosphoribosyl-dephospho-CoA transferase
VKVHDLLWISKGSELWSLDHPSWVRDALGQAPVVVVRRTEAPRGFVAVGIRGTSREQRHAAFLRKQDVLARRTPGSLAAEQAWHRSSLALPLALFTALEMVGELSKKRQLLWGPIGSVGYQLATGMPATSATSDLDLLVRCNDLLDHESLRALHALQLGVRFDVILEGPQGAVALDEYLQNRRTLIKTKRGPRVAVFSW